VGVIASRTRRREGREGDYAAQQPNFAASRPSREMVLHGQY
jgi:hypothetical protein